MYCPQRKIVNATAFFANYKGTSCRVRFRSVGLALKRINLIFNKIRKLLVGWTFSPFLYVGLDRVFRLLNKSNRVLFQSL